MQQLKAYVSFVLLTGTVAASTWLLLQLREQEWLPAPPELLDAPPEQAIYGVVWLLALSLTGWVAVASVLSAVVYSDRPPATVRAFERMTLLLSARPVRRWASLLLAIGSLTIVSAAGATVVPPIPLVGGSDQPLAAEPDTTTPFPDLQQGVRVPGALPLGTRSVRQEEQLLGDSKAIKIPPFLSRGSRESGFHGLKETVAYTIRPGDNLWSISAAHIMRRGDGESSQAEIAALWRQVITLGRERLRSGNPDLVYPGERILLPQLSTASDG